MIFVYGSKTPNVPFKKLEGFNMASAFLQYIVENYDDLPETFRVINSDRVLSFGPENDFVGFTGISGQEFECEYDAKPHDLLDLALICKELFKVMPYYFKFDPSQSFYVHRD